MHLHKSWTHRNVISFKVKHRQNRKNSDFFRFNFYCMWIKVLKLYIKYTKHSRKLIAAFCAYHIPCLHLKYGLNQEIIAHTPIVLELWHIRQANNKKCGDYFSPNWTRIECLDTTDLGVESAAIITNHWFPRTIEHVIVYKGINNSAFLQ